MKIVLVNGGLSEASSTTRLVQAIRAELARVADERGLELDVMEVGLRPLAHDAVNMVLTGVPSANLEAALDTLEAADATVWATPTYAGSYAGVFKTFMDLVGAQRLEGKPVLLAATAASPRHTPMVDTAMRPLASALRAWPVPVGIFSTGEPGEDLTSRITAGVEGLLLALAGGGGELGAVMKKARVQAGKQQAEAVRSTLAAPQAPVNRTKPQAPYLASDGKAALLRPDTEDFTEMGAIFGALS